MVTIRCVNTKCPKKKFEWDETTRLKEGGRIADPNEAGAEDLLAPCPYCGTDNTIWVIGLKHNQAVWRK